jgi:hypothetical protein
LTTLVVVGLWFVVVLEASTSTRALAVGGLALTLLAAYVAVLALPGLRDFFALAVPGFWAVVGVIGGATLTIGGLALTDERFLPATLRRPPPAALRGLVGRLLDD